MRNKIFIIIPVFNRLSYTKKCLSSLENQTYKNFEVIIVNDGSTDDTSEYIKNEYPFWTILKGSGNWWWTKSMYTGIEYALRYAKLGDFILSLNNDCYAKKDYLFEIINASKKNKGAIVGSLVVDADNPRKIIESGVRINWKDNLIYANTDKLSELSDYVNTENIISKVDTLPGKGTLIPIEVFDKAGNFNYSRLPHYISDYEFFIRAKKHDFRLIVSTKAKLFNFSKETGTAHLTGFKSSYKEVSNVLFSRKSKLNIIDYFNFLLLSSPKKYFWLNMKHFIKRLMYFILNLSPFCYIGLIISKIALFRHNLPILIAQNTTTIRIKNVIETKKNTFKKINNTIFSIIPILYLLIQSYIYREKFGYFIGDLGREMYVPTRILEGQKMYQDFNWLYGPFSAWINAVAFKLYGTNVNTLLIVSIAICIGVTFYTYKLLNKYISPVFSSLLTIIFLRISAFGFTWQSLILPGKYATLWGLLFSIIIINELVSKRLERKLPNYYLIGLLSGILLITKIDYAFAILLTVLIDIVINKNLKQFLIFVISTIVTIIPTSIYLIAWQDTTINAILNNILPQFASSYWFVHREFYDWPSTINSLYYQIGIILALAYLCLDKFGSYIKGTLTSVLKYILIIYFLFFANFSFLNYDFYRSYYILSLIIVPLWLANKSISRNIKVSLIEVLFFITALNMRSKLAVSSFDLGFLFITTVTPLILTLENGFSHNIIFNRRLTKSIVTIVLMLIFVKQSIYLNSAQFMNDDSYHKILSATVQYLKDNSTRFDTISSFPIESSIPFLANLRNPLYYDQLVNGLLSPEKENEFIDSIQKNKPTYITISNYNFLGYFGKDYYNKVYDWINNNYNEIASYGCVFPYSRDVKCRDYGIRIFKIKI